MIAIRLVTTGIVASAACSAIAGELSFKKHVLSTEFYSEGCAAGDFNKDGRIDVVAGPFWYQAPEGNDIWRPHEIRTPGKFVYNKGYSKSFVNAVVDVNKDGWDDVIIVGFPGESTHWYENPQGKEGHWPEHVIFDNTCNESPQVADVNQDGLIDLVFGSEKEKRMLWFSLPADGGAEAKWTRSDLVQKDSAGTCRFCHGLGVGDVNNDGRNDVLIRQGWWEAPSDPKSTDWTYHEAPLGEDCADMHVYDFDDDGDMDVISSSAHRHGLWWHEQITDGGTSSWKTHTIYDKVSQMHALVLTDMNADGLPDLVTGKRFYAHNGHDPGGKDPAVLMWFEFSRKDGKPTWTPHEIDDDSGIGTQFVVTDINGDKRPDIVTSNKRGTFVFIQRGDAKTVSSR